MNRMRPHRYERSIESWRKTSRRYGARSPRPRRNAGSTIMKEKVASSSRELSIEVAPRMRAITTRIELRGATHRQASVAAMSGPRTGPRTMPAMLDPRHHSHALWRVRPCIVVTSTPPVAARITPAAAPVSARATRSSPTFRASGVMRPTIVKAMPAQRNADLRPRMSESRPPATQTRMSAIG